VACCPGRMSPQGATGYACVCPASNAASAVPCTPPTGESLPPETVPLQKVPPATVAPGTTGGAPTGAASPGVASSGGSAGGSG
jgi:hypothetical protein